MEAEELCKANKIIGPRTKHASCPWINRDGSDKVSHPHNCGVLWRTTQENTGQRAVNRLKIQSYLYLEGRSNPSRRKSTVLENISNIPVARAIANLFCILLSFNCFKNFVPKELRDAFSRKAENTLSDAANWKLKYISRGRCELFLVFWFIALLTCLYVCVMLAALYKGVLSDHCNGSCSVSESLGYLKKSSDTRLCWGSKENIQEIQQFKYKYNRYKFNCGSDLILQIDTHMI